jgi:hypothetical protein
LLPVVVAEVAKMAIVVEVAAAPVDIELHQALQ